VVQHEGCCPTLLTGEAAAIQLSLKATIDVSNRHPQQHCNSYQPTISNIKEEKRGRIMIFPLQHILGFWGLNQ